VAGVPGEVGGYFAGLLAISPRVIRVTTITGSKYSWVMALVQLSSRK
jgi:hypothetical protein